MTGRPFTHPVRVERIPPQGLRLTLSADAAQREALARHLDLPSVKSLVAELEINPLPRKGFYVVNGQLTAELEQVCGVTLQPIPARVEESFRLSFAPPEAIEAEAEEIELSLEDEDPPDPISEGQIDVAELVVEQLALGLDPFPRAEGAHFTPLLEEEEEAEIRPNPFAALAAWKPKAE